LPDGRTQIVTYTADWRTGFHADVRYEGVAQFPDQYNTGVQGGYNDNLNGNVNNNNNNNNHHQNHNQNHHQNHNNNNNNNNNGNGNGNLLNAGYDYPGSNSIESGYNSAPGNTQ
jgi:hypothetical protein